MAKSGKKKRNQKKSILYIDLESTSSWTMLGPEEISAVYKYTHDVFQECSDPFNCDHIKREAFRGDDALAYFDDENDCISAAINFYSNIPDMIRRVPHIEHVTVFSPRIIAFNDIVSGDTPEVYAGQHIPQILPYERDFGKAGTLRVVGDELFFQLNSPIKSEFRKMEGTVKGKRGTDYPLYEYRKPHNTQQIRKRYLPPYIPKHQEQLYKFYSNNLATRNAITLSLIKKVARQKGKSFKKGTAFSKNQFTKTVLDCCKAFLELTVSGSLPKDKDWKFKLSYWSLNKSKNKLLISSFSYPQGIPCICHEKDIELDIGDNIIGECFKTGKPVIKDANEKGYKPLHRARDKSIKSVAAFPVINPVDREVVGVLSIDTRIDSYFTDKPAELKYHVELLSSFTMNLALANFLI